VAATVRLRIPDPRRWWPNGHGDQPLYTARLSLWDASGVLDAVEVPFALRTVVLRQEKDDEGRSFVIEVNGVKIFCKGADWIPCDNFLPRIPDATYERLLALAKDAHMNMIRVWGGGIYEQDVFYRTCDRLGLMVWQDFMFACGEYPEQRWFLDAVKKEALSVVRRLRNHPSIVVWCGNNESEWLFCTENPDKSPDDMIGARIFNDILPAVCRAEDGTRPYWRSSPFGSGFPNGESDGNHHQWTVWSAWQDYRAYERDNARFVTEFGFQAPANRRTFEEVLPPEDRWPQSAAFEHHNKQVEGPERLFRFQAAHHRVAADFDGFIYKCQLVQAEALKCAVEHWRRRKFKTAGALFWQLNDCWPVSSWAVVDSALRPKAAYYFAKHFFRPLLVSFKRAGPDVEIHVTNDRMEAVSGTLTVALRSFRGETRRSMTQPMRVAGNSTRRVAVVRPDQFGLRDPGTEYLTARVVAAGKIAAQNRYFFEEPKRLRLPAARVSVAAAAEGDGRVRLRISSDRFVKYLRLELEGEEALFEDNYLDLDAGEHKEILLETPMPIERIQEQLRARWLV
jgi:beta-mannosidase